MPNNCTSKTQSKRLMEKISMALSAQNDLFCSLLDEIESLKTQMKKMENRQTYLEYDLHAENRRLRDTLHAYSQEVDYYSEDYCSNEDSVERED